MRMTSSLKAKINRIKVLAMDVDGVLTNGQLIFDGEGRELKSFHVQDGYGIVLWKRCGLKTAIITAGNSQVVKVRSDYLHIDQVYLGVYPKIEAYQKMLKALGVTDEQVCFVGDDLTDCQIFDRAGFAVAVFNAVDEVKKKADWMTTRCGGDGAIREVIELVLKTQKLWHSAIAQDL